MDTNTLLDAPAAAQDASQPESSQKNALASAQATSGSKAIKLRLVNQSSDMNTSQVVIFQRNVSTSFNAPAVAWRVIENLSHGWSHPFTYSADVEARVQDANGNVSPALPLAPGQAAQVVRTESGVAFQLASTSANAADEQEVRNELPQSAVSATILRDGLPVATLQGITPGQKAVFKLKPTLYIGVVSQVEQGEALNSAILSDINTEISLLGIQSADIIMTGGGPGKSSQPFTFTLANVKLA
jgi:hypothetical protein